MWKLKLFLAVVLFAGGCKGTEPPSPSSEPAALIDVEPGVDTVLVTHTMSLRATVKDAANNPLTGRAVSWTSSNTAVATVNSSTGVVTGVAQGVVEITASAEGRTGKASLTVLPASRFEGQIVQPVFRDEQDAGQVALSGVSVRFIFGIDTLRATSDAAGRYLSPDLQAGPYTVEFEKAGMTSVRYHALSLLPGRTLRLEQAPLVPASSATGTITGEVTDAQAAEGVVSTVELRPGMNNAQGPAAHTLQTPGFAGIFSFTVPAGTYTMVARAAGYVDAVRTIAVVGARHATATTDIGIVSAASGAGLYRAVLTYTDTLGLGLMATGPNADGSRFRLAQDLGTGSSTGEPFVELNYGLCVGCIQGVSMYQQRPGVYRFSVINYNDTLTTNSSRLSYAGAKVELYKGNTRVATFHPPFAAGNLWAVFEIEGDAVRSLDTITNISSPTLVSVIASPSGRGRLMSRP